jgi:phage terminase small subunit
MATRKRNVPKRDNPRAVGTEAKQDLFVLEYLKDFNATRAAKAIGHSSKTASLAGSTYLKNILVQQKLADALNARKERLRIDADEILRELTVLCRSDVRDFRVRESGKLTLRKGADDSAWRAVSSVKHRIRTVQMNNGQRQIIREVEVRLWSKTEALALARKHLGLDRENAEKVDPLQLATAIRRKMAEQDAKEGLTDGLPSNGGDPDA